MNERERQDDLPPALRDALRRRERAPEIPEGIDRAVMLRARLRLQTVRRARLVRRVAGVAAVAAVVLLVVWWPGSTPEAPPQRRDSVVADRHDVDGDGVVDMVDAYVLWKSGGATPELGVADVERRAVSVR